MIWQLLSHGAVLGTTGPEMPSPGPTTRTWPLIPTSDFDSIRPLIAAMEELQRSPGAGIPAEILEIVDDGERGRAIQTWIRTDAHARQRVALFEQLNALGLQLVDEGGAVLAAWSIGIVQLPPLDVPFIPEMRDDFVEAGFADGPPFYMVVAALEEPEILRRTVPAGGDASQASS